MENTEIKENTVKFHFIKAADYQEFFTNGMFGGICPNGNISVALYSERPPIPREIVHSIDGRKLGPELTEKRIVEEDCVRVVHAVVQMDLVVAKSFLEWLKDIIRNVEETSKKL